MSRNDLKSKAVLGRAKNLGGLLSKDYAAKGTKIANNYNNNFTKADAEKTLTETYKWIQTDIIDRKGKVAHPKFEVISVKEVAVTS
jgi:propanediol dehydratase large subunit